MTSVRERRLVIEAIGYHFEKKAYDKELRKNNRPKLTMPFSFLTFENMTSLKSARTETSYSKHEQLNIIAIVFCSN